jgi:hypothetical protein
MTQSRYERPVHTKQAAQCEVVEVKSRSLLSALHRSAILYESTVDTGVNYHR